MKTIWAIFAMLTLVIQTGSCANQTPSFSLTLSTPGRIHDKYIAGEPLQFALVWRNNGSEPFTLAFGTILQNPLVQIQIKGPTRNECTAPRLQAKWKPLATFALAPGEAATTLVSPADFGAVNEGDYDLWVIYNPSDLSQDWDQVKINRTRLESNHIHFTIIQASGEDASALQKFGTSCRTIPYDNASLSKQILSEFPHSTYAGWILTGRISFPEKTSSSDLQRLNRINLPALPEAARKRVAETEKGMDAYSMEQLRALSEYLAARPDFVGADWMKFRLAYWKAYRREYEESRRILKQLSDNTQTSTWVRQHTQSLTDYLKTFPR